MARFGRGFIGRQGVPNKPQSAVIGPLRKVTEFVEKLPASLSFTGTSPRNTSHVLSAALSFFGVLSRITRHTFSATLEFAGTLGRKTTHILTASLEFAGKLNHNVSKTLK